MATLKAETFPFLNRVLINSGDFVECVAYRKLLQSGWKLSLPIQKLKLADGSYTTCYGNAQLTCTLIDSEKTKRVITRMFKVMDISSYDILLGLARLAEINSIIDWAAGSWRFCSEKPAKFCIENLRRFSKTSHHKGIYMLTAEKENPNPLPGLPNCYQEYADVFPQEAASKLPDGSMEHLIDLQEDKMPPWKTIYAMSTTELDTLRKYLEDKQQQG